MIWQSKVGPYRPVGTTPCCVAAFPEADDRLVLQQNTGQDSSYADKADVQRYARMRGGWFTRSEIIEESAVHGLSWAFHDPGQWTRGLACSVKSLESDFGIDQGTILVGTACIH